MTIPDPLRQPSLADLRQRTSIKWQAHPKDVLPLWVAEMDVMLADPVRDALVAAVDRGDTGYPAGTRYAAAVQAFASERWGFDGVAVERTAIVPDVMIGLMELLRLVTEPGSAVVVNCPVYPPFYAFLEHLPRRVVEAPLTPAHRLDLVALEAAFVAATADGRAAAYLLCNPHNPTGTVHTADELASVAELAARHGVRLLADEIHAPLVLPGAHFTPVLSVPGAETAFSVTSASKGWNLAGLKSALAIAGPGAAADLARLPEEVGHGASHLAVIAHTAALELGRGWLDALLLGLDANRVLLGDLLAAELPGVGYQAPQATYLAWLDCRGLDLGDDSAAERGLSGTTPGPATHFLEHARVALSAGPAFGSGGAGHVRLNFATSPEILTEAVRRMGASVR